MVLGEEAEYAACEACGLADLVDSGVCCEACGGWFHRRTCWSNHWCDYLTDHNGRLVRVGDILAYCDNLSRIYTIVETPETYSKWGMCLGERKKGGNIEHIRPRLMQII